jgi:hypothetical protein
MNTSFISAFFGAQVGMMQLAVAGRLAHMDSSMGGMGADNMSAIAQLVDAADASGTQLANAAAGVGTKLDISC